jgi:hypothetical protein
METLRIFLQRVARNSNPLTGLVLATIGLLIIFSVVQLTDVQIGVIMTFVGSLVVFISAYMTPVDDPRLPIGTIVNETSSAPTGIVVDASDWENRAL